MLLQDIAVLLSKLSMAGARAVTITGGGEPVMHPKFDKIIEIVKTLGMRSGLVSNGILLPKVSQASLNTLSWLRVSVSDDRDIEEVLGSVRVAHSKSNGMLGWAFSYVLSEVPDYDKLARVIEFANSYNFTHVRIVSDLLDTENVPEMAEVQKHIQLLGINDSLVIYQGRKTATLGAKRCWISLLKPMFSSDGKMFPCCGVQYAMEPPALDFDDRMVMGNLFSWRLRYIQQTPFDGSNCARCYYSDYNQALEAILTPLDHEDFV
jgi:organic radical activating enzyme